MGYDIDLLDPVTRETIELPVKHLMIGNMYEVDYDSTTGTFSPKPTAEARLGITYNYSNYYYDAAEGDDRFFGQLDDDREDDEPRNLGIRGIYGKTGAESIPMLKDMIVRITNKYSDENGKWFTRKRTERRYRQKSTGKIVDFSDFIHDCLHGEGEGEIEPEEYTEYVNEGSNRDYWKATAGNAIKPLFQLIAMAQLRPDGIWHGD